MRAPTLRRSYGLVVFLLTSIAAPAAASGPDRTGTAGVARQTPPLMISIAIASQAKGVAETVPAIVEEANRIWRRYGVRLQPDAEPCTRPLRIVILDDPPPGTFGADEDEGGKGLGWITFLAPGKPRDILYLSWKRTLALLAETNAARTPPEQMPDRLRETLLARALGRTLAHEIGHYLLSSAAHTPTGLMRRAYSAPQLFGPAVGGFDLDAAEQEKAKGKSPLAPYLLPSAFCRAFVAFGMLNRLANNWYAPSVPAGS